MGEVTLDADGEPTSYTVASGDTADQIRMRFNIWWDQLQQADGGRLIKYPNIYPGDVYTFTTSQAAAGFYDNDD